MAAFAPTAVGWASGVSAQSSATEHPIDLMLESNAPFAASACHSSAASAVDFGAGTGQLAPHFAEHHDLLTASHHPWKQPTHQVELS
jgi:hypothetical protein